MVFFLNGFTIKKRLVRQEKNEVDGSKPGKCIQGARRTEPPPPRLAGLTAAVREVGVWRRARQ